MNAFLREFVGFISASLSGPKVASWSFFSIYLSGTARLTKFGSSRLKTLHSPRKDQGFLRLVGAFNPYIASVV